MNEIGFFTQRRKNGTVEVVSADDGWVITGRGKVSTLRARIPRCRCTKHVCPALHRDHHGLPSVHNTDAHKQHGVNHCHGGHVERVRKLIDAIGATYGPRVK